jgi:calpain-15
MEDPASYPEYVLAIHSSKRLLVEQISPPAYVLADAIISLTLAKGQRHEVRGWSPSKLSSKQMFSFSV